MRMRLGALALVAMAAAGRAGADEGMWTFDNFPAAAVKAKYGVDTDAAWLDHVRGAAVRLSTGCSASIVSANGLVLTNHHCVRGCAQQISTPDTDYVKAGFQAVGRREERACAGMIAEVLQSIDDVGAKIDAAVAGRTALAFVQARDAAVAGIEKAACAGREATTRCQVVSLYQGGQYKLYTYAKYTDVRLIFAPEQQTAFFGGDPDNFNFPRYDLDCAFVRLYADGHPVATTDHLAWRTTAPKPGEPVFVAGNPGTTQRLFTADQLEFQRDISLPYNLASLAQLRGRLVRFGEESPEHARIAETTLFGVENSYKALHGQEETLSDPPFIAAKRREEAQLRARVAADPKLATAIGDPWSDVARVQADRAGLYAPNALAELGGRDSLLHTWAVRLVRAAEERAKPNGERLPEYADARLPALEKSTLDPQPVYPELEQLVLEAWATELREILTVDSPTTAIFLGHDSPEALSRRLAGSGLGDAALRKRLWDGGLDAIRASDDPMIRYVLATDAAARAARHAYDDRVNGPTAAATKRIAQARFAVYGSGAYPDATFTLRLSYGAIEGWSYRGRSVAPTTSFAGLFDRATGQAPFELAPHWLAARATLDPATVFDVSNSTDIIGGNSGSPLIDARGRVIGAVFDGNIHSLGGAYAYDPAVNRAVAVSTVAITEALRKVYHDDALVQELLEK